MAKKISFGVLALLFALMSVGVLVQLTSASINTGVENNAGSQLSQTIVTRTPTAGTIPTRTPTPTAKLRLYHFADLAAGDVPLDITLGGELLTILSYGESTNYENVPIGQLLLEIQESMVRSPLTIPVSQTVSFSNNEYYSVVLSGDNGANQPTTIDIFIDDNSKPTIGRAKVRVGHFAPFDNDIANTRVDLREKASGVIVGGLNDVQYGMMSSYFELLAGVEYDLVITNVDGSVTVLDIAPVIFEEGEIVTIIVGGGGANQDLAVSINSNIRQSYLPQIFKLSQ